MADPITNKNLWDSPAGREEESSKKSFWTSYSNGITLFLTAVIIAGGFLLPTLLSPMLDAYRNNVIALPSPSDDSHVFDEPVTFYPWNLYSAEQTRSLTTYEANTIQQSGVANLLISNMQLRGIELVYEYDEYVSRIISSFRCLEPVDSVEPSCFVLYNADIDFDEVPDVRCCGMALHGITSNLIMMLGLIHLSAPPVLKN